MLSVCDVAFRRVLQIVVLLFRSTEFNKLEIVVLRHELALVAPEGRRPALQPADRFFLTAASRLLPRVRWASFLVTPTTLHGLAPALGGESTYPRCAGRVKERGTIVRDQWA